MDNNKIPVRKLVFSDVPGESGVKTIAFVDAPAIMVNWVAFNEQKPIQVCFADEEKGIILSPLAIPEQLIRRVDPKTKEEFYVFLDAETISEIQFNWSREGRQTMANEMHDSKKPVDGVVWFSNFQSDGVNILNPPAYKDLPKGTMYVMGKINNPELKSKIKDGTYKGISLEGYFDQMDVADLEPQQIEAIIESFL